MKFLYNIHKGDKKTMKEMIWIVADNCALINTAIDTIVYTMRSDNAPTYAIAQEDCLKLYDFENIIPLEEISDKEKTEILNNAVNLLHNNDSEIAFGVMVKYNGSVCFLIISEEDEASLYDMKLKFVEKLYPEIQEIDYDTEDEEIINILDTMRG